MMTDIIWGFKLIVGLIGGFALYLLFALAYAYFSK